MSVGTGSVYCDGALYLVFIFLMLPTALHLSGTEVIRPEPRPLPDEQTQALAALVTRRHQLIEMLTAEKNRLACARSTVRNNLRAPIAWLERALQHADTGLADAIQHSPVWREKDDAMLKHRTPWNPILVQHA